MSTKETEDAGNAVGVLVQWPVNRTDSVTRHIFMIDGPHLVLEQW